MKEIKKHCSRLRYSTLLVKREFDKIEICGTLQQIGSHTFIANTRIITGEFMKISFELFCENGIPTTNIRCVYATNPKLCNILPTMDYNTLQNVNNLLYQIGCDLVKKGYVYDDKLHQVSELNSLINCDGFVTLI